MARPTATSHHLGPAARLALVAAGLTLAPTSAIAVSAVAFETADIGARRGTRGAAGIAAGDDVTTAFGIMRLTLDRSTEVDAYAGVAHWDFDSPVVDDESGLEIGGAWRKGLLTAERSQVADVAFALQGSLLSIDSFLMIGVDPHVIASRTFGDRDRRVFVAIGLGIAATYVDFDAPAGVADDDELETDLLIHLTGGFAIGDGFDLAVVLQRRDDLDRVGLGVRFAL